MAVFNSTKRKFKVQYEQGLTYFNKINVETLELLNTDNSILNNHFNIIEFYTDNQQGYYDKALTWAWFKCHLSSQVVYDICIKTELANHIEHFACITHDKDNSEPHTHCLIKFYRNQKASKLVDYFHADNCSNALNNKYKRFKYLTHDSDTCRKEGKYQYSEDELLTDDLQFFKGLQSMEVDITPMSIIESIIQGKSERYMCQTYGDRWIYNRSRYKDCACQIMIEENIKTHVTFEIVNITDTMLGIYDKSTGELVEISRDLDECKARVYGLKKMGC